MVSAFALFPLVAIFYQFGWKQSLIAAVVVLMTRVVVVRYFPPKLVSIEIFIGMVMLLGIAITHDLRHRDENDIDASGLSVFEERTVTGLSKTYPISPSWSIDCRRCQHEDFSLAVKSISHWRKHIPQA